METLSDTFQRIRNTTCIACGKGFSIPRAGKLYCSAKCKQFSFYHKEEIEALKLPNKGINETPIKLSINDYERYNSIVRKVNELRELKRRQNSAYLSFDQTHEDRLKNLEKNLPGYFKNIIPKMLSIEIWSFFKVLYPHLKREEFFKIIDSFDPSFLGRLAGDEDYVKVKDDILRKQFESHLKKIAEGKIIFT